MTSPSNVFDSIHFKASTKSAFTVECQQDGFTRPAAVAAPVSARQVNPSRCCWVFFLFLFSTTAYLPSS